MREIKRILVLSGPGIGDVITSIPAINNLKYSFPNAKIDVLNESVHGVGSKFLENNKNIAELIKLERAPSEVGWRKIKLLPKMLFGKTSIFSKAQFIFSLMRKEYDIIFNCYPSTKKSAIFSFIVGRKIRAGIASNPYSFLFNIKAEPERKHKIDIESELIEKIGGRIKDRKVHLNLDLKSAEKKVAIILKKNKIEKDFVIIHTSRPNDYRVWDNKKWAEVAAFFTKKKIDVLLIGSGTDCVLVKELHSIAKNTIDLCGQFSLEETAALIKKSRLVLCTNSGVMNLACALEAKTIALSGPSTFGWNAFGKNAINIRGTFDYKECKGPCETHKECAHLKCMTTITSDMVLSKIKQALK